MALGAIRPRFRVTLPAAADDLVARVHATAGDPRRRCVSRVLGHHVDITVVEEDRHRWSPCVQLEFRPSDDGTGTVVDGLVGPHPHQWTMFMFINTTVAIAGGFGLMLGLAQRSLDQPAWGLWTTMGAAIVLAGMYVVSQVGQRLAAEQTRALMHVVEEALGTTTA